MKLRLRFFEDDANGAWGVAPEECISYDESFNAFWSGFNGIFHDVFEHYFERQHKYFHGQYSLNVAGEVVAMGHMAYYLHGMLSHERNGPGKYVTDADIIENTHHLLVDACRYGNTNFGSEFLSKIPYQRPGNTYIDEIAEFHSGKLEGLQFNSAYSSDDRDRESAKLYRKSITPLALTNCYRYGWRMAERMVPNTQHNRIVIDDFMRFWNEFCLKHSARELAQDYRAIDFNIKGGPKLSWSAHFIDHENGRHRYNNLHRI